MPPITPSQGTVIYTGPQDRVDPRHRSDGCVHAISFRPTSCHVYYFMVMYRLIDSNNHFLVQ